jgi:hypothetical protein
MEIPPYNRGDPMDFGTWLATTPLGTALKAAVAVVLTLGVADWVGAGSISLTNWQTWIIAGIGSAAPVIVNWLNSSDARYGRGSAGE